MILLRTIRTALVLLLATIASSACGQADPELLEEQAVKAAVEKVEPSIVRFETIGGSNRVDGQVVANGPATGVAVSKDGYVISSSFHFAHQPASILARLPDGKTASAEIVGRDLSRKIVLLKIQTEFEFNVPDTVEPDKLQVGQTVVAVGRVLDAKTPNVSTGILSAKNRIWNKALQTDAKISPANFGGPLTDLLGRVVGILVPMSHRDDGEMAGTEWYDSGIGFAVPLTGLLERLEQLKSGTPLRRGLLGVSFKGTDLYVDKAIVAFCSASSPAGDAGIQVDDEIVELNGLPITRQSELKHAVGPLYEGDKADLIVLRDGKKIPFTIELAGEIPPYQRPGIGITLLAGEDDALTVERVLDGSPAEKAELRPDDEIVSFENTELKDAADLRSKLATASIGSDVELAVKRDDKLVDLKIKIKALSAGFFEADKFADKHEARMSEIKVADAANRCFALTPETDEAAPPPALLVWISSPGKLEKKSIEDAWLDQCQRHNVAILFPESTDQKRWSPDDAHFIETAIENFAKQSPFDSTRVVVGGQKTGGTMASLIAFGRRDLFQGLVMIDANPSTRVTRLETSPVKPLLVLFGTGNVDPLLKKNIKRFKEANFPTQVEEQKLGLRSWIKMLLPWVETVNRL